VLCRCETEPLHHENYRGRDEYRRCVSACGGCRLAGSVTPATGGHGRSGGSVEATRQKFHDSAESMYGVKVEDHVLGQGSTKPGGVLRKGT
jgi:hypothetical protein